MTILFLNLQITRPDIKHASHIKWVVSLVIAYDHYNHPLGLFRYVWVNILTLSVLRGHIMNNC